MLYKIETKYKKEIFIRSCIVCDKCIWRIGLTFHKCKNVPNKFEYKKFGYMETIEYHCQECIKNKVYNLQYFADVIASKKILQYNKKKKHKKN